MACFCSTTCTTSPKRRKARHKVAFDAEDTVERAQRSAFFDEFVYSIAPDQLKVQDTRSLGQDLAAITFLQQKPW